MKIKPSDLIQKNDNSIFTIFEDPFGGAWYFDKKLKTVSKYPGDFNDQIHKVKNKIEAKKTIIYEISNNVL